MRTDRDRQTDMTKVIVAFLNFASALNDLSFGLALLSLCVIGEVPSGLRKNSTSSNICMFDNLLLGTETNDSSDNEDIFIFVGI